MRHISLLLLTVLLLTALAPGAALTYGVNTNASASLGVLDVCRQARPAISSSGFMPFIQECPCGQVPSLIITYLDSTTTPFPQFLFPSQYDRPPQA